MPFEIPTIAQVDEQIVYHQGQLNDLKDLRRHLVRSAKRKQEQSHLTDEQPGAIVNAEAQPWADVDNIGA